MIIHVEIFQIGNVNTIGILQAPLESIGAENALKLARYIARVEALEGMYKALEEDIYKRLRCIPDEQMRVAPLGHTTSQVSKAFRAATEPEGELSAKETNEREFIIWMISLPTHKQHKLLEALFDQLKWRPLAATEPEGETCVT